MVGGNRRVKREREERGEREEYMRGRMRRKRTFAHIKMCFPGKHIHCKL